MPKHQKNSEQLTQELSLNYWQLANPELGFKLEDRLLSSSAFSTSNRLPLRYLLPT
jgi:hypothetical protein